METEKQVVGTQNYNYPRIRVSKESYDKIAYYANESDKTLNEITSALIEFAIEYLEVKEEMVPVTKLFIGNKEV